MFGNIALLLKHFEDGRGTDGGLVDLGPQSLRDAAGDVFKEAAARVRLVARASSARLMA